jgi:tryptophan halogenase
MILNNLAIVGGGTSGLVTALILKKTYPNLKIDIIESDKIGIVGVGEGSTEHWNNFMMHCDINTSDLIRETGATFKYGINFENWNGDGKNYIQSVSSAFNIESQSNSKFVYAWLIANGHGPENLIHKYVEKSLHRKPYWSINQFHFDTFKLNKYLHDLCEKRNIGIIKAEIDQVKLAEDGSISTLTANDSRIFDYEFYIDSTGFHRLMLQKTMGVKWRSYQKYLPMNSAIAFPTERTDSIPSWTLSKALDAGWLWRIPTQDRYGNGYVFNDQFMDFDRAQQEVETLYGHSVNIGKQIKFDAGCLEKFWVKNCVAIGLSSSFVEPLEASSIGCSIQQAFLLSTAISSYVPGIPYAERVFNRECDELLDNILDFIALHYVVKRNDTEFWKTMKELPKPPGLEEKLEIYKHNFPGKGDFENRRVMFKEPNWILVMHGLGLITREVAQREVANQPEHLIKAMSYNIANIVGDQAEPSEEYVDHRTALQWLLDNPEHP